MDADQFYDRQANILIATVSINNSKYFSYNACSLCDIHIDTNSMTTTGFVCWDESFTGFSVICKECIDGSFDNYRDIEKKSVVKWTLVPVCDRCGKRLQVVDGYEETRKIVGGDKNG